MIPSLWFAPWQVMAAMAPGLCGPARVTFAPPAALFGPFAPVWAIAMDPGRNPWIAFGASFGPLSFAVRQGEREA
ncbi:MAG: hypothetical protein ACK4TB_17125 [Gemmobacter sp.]